ncbi:hypothetical protein NUW58_g5394 [Xylaria curta]|uniref:Uncharacterized protein n=1 Tax=Xylaria curta TaxID=42375 RepID=A0ACC1P1Q9_9PEZI|nr:hypothetical protein NUW58_g5394 [Xylaria curta]
MPLFRRGSNNPLTEELLDCDGRQLFVELQYQMDIPFFTPSTRRFDLRPAHVLPYYKPSQQRHFVERAYRSRGSVLVSKILIHPLCHAWHHSFRDFQDADEAMWFALKEFRGNDLEQFQEEVNTLCQFNAKSHPHLETLVAAINYPGTQFLIFPWSTCDLGRCWEYVRRKPDVNDAELVRWIAHQTLMLVHAIRSIRDLDGDGGVLEGGVEVGFRGRESDTTSKYRPPELDYVGGEMHSASDMWSLGCVLLEMANWLVGGLELLQDMETKRATPHSRAMGSDFDQFFEWVYVEGAECFTIRVKEAVTQGIDTLRSHERCSQFVCDLLNVVEDHMLVVEPDSRLSASLLERKMVMLDDKCRNAEAYCVGRHQDKKRDARKPSLWAREFKTDMVPALMQEEYCKRVYLNERLTDHLIHTELQYHELGSGVDKRHHVIFEARIHRLKSMIPSLGMEALLWQQQIVDEFDT